jgi:acyl-CoA thioesterase FadM
MMHYLNNVGIKSERLSVAKKHYTDMAGVVHDERLFGPNESLIIDELLELRIMPNDKVDHPRKGSKDLADATCGAIFNAIAYTQQGGDEEIGIKTYADSKREYREEIREGLKGKFDGTDVIVAPSKTSGVSANDQYEKPKTMPKELSEYLANIKTI